MTKIEEIKKALKKLQPNLNPEKASYKTIEDILNNDFTAEELLKKVGTIKGISKFPNNLKEIYNSIVSNLNDLVVEERKALEIKKQEDNTRKLKVIVEALEKDIKPEDKLSKEEEEEVIKEDLGLTPKKVVEKIKEEVKEEKENGQLVSKILLSLVVLTLLIIVLLILFY